MIHSHHNLCVSKACLHKDYDSLASAIKTYTNTVYAENRLDPIIKCNMKLVAGFLISKKNQAASQNKQLNVTLADDFIYSALPEYKQEAIQHFLRMPL